METQTTIKYNPVALTMAKFVFWFGIAAFVLWLNPFSIDQLFAFALPIVILAFIGFAMFGMGSSFLELVNSKAIGKQVQDALRAVRDSAVEAINDEMPCA